MTQHDRGIGSEAAGGWGQRVLRLLQRQIDDVAGAQQRLPAGEQVVQADPHRDTGVDAGQVEYRFDGLAAVGIGAVRSRQDDQFAALYRCPTHHLCVQQRTRSPQRQRPVQDKAERRAIQRQRCHA